jgi:hypothetical protein
MVFFYCDGGVTRPFFTGAENFFEDNEVFLLLHQENK